MTIDPTITIGNIVMIVTMIVGAVGAWFLLRGDLTAAKEDVVDLKARLDALTSAHAATLQRVEQVRAKSANELAQFQLKVASEYATHAAIKEVEGRVVEAINRLGDRFDKYFDRGAPSSRSRGGQSHNG